MREGLYYSLLTKKLMREGSYYFSAPPTFHATLPIFHSSKIVVLQGIITWVDSAAYTHTIPLPQRLH